MSRPAPASLRMPAREAAGRGAAGPTVKLLLRPGQPGYFSIERVFRALVPELAGAAAAELVEVPYPGQGVLSRTRALCWAAGLRGDVLHVTGDVYFLALGLPRRASVLTVHDCTSLYRLRGWRRALLLRLWYRWPVRRSRVVTAISHFVAGELELLGLVPRERIRVIHDPVGAEFKFTPRPFDQVRPTLLHLGVKPNKNLVRLALALRGIPCRLQIVGRPEPEQAAALAENRIEYTAEAEVSGERLLELYHRADLVVFASTYEGFGMPIAEAQATGRPVVTSCVASMPEVAGGAACLVDPFEVESIRAGVLRVLGEPGYREYLVAEGLRNAARFEPARIARQYADVYREVGCPGKDTHDG